LAGLRHTDLERDAGGQGTLEPPKCEQNGRRPVSVSASAQTRNPALGTRVAPTPLTCHRDASSHGRLHGEQTDLHARGRLGARDSDDRKRLHEDETSDAYLDRLSRDARKAVGVGHLQPYGVTSGSRERGPQYTFSRLE